MLTDKGAGIEGTVDPIISTQHLHITGQGEEDLVIDTPLLENDRLRIEQLDLVVQQDTHVVVGCRGEVGLQILDRKAPRIILIDRNQVIHCTKWRPGTDLLLTVGIGYCRVRENDSIRLIVGKILDIPMDHPSTDIDLLGVGRLQIVLLHLLDRLRLQPRLAFLFQHAIHHTEGRNIGIVGIGVVTILPQGTETHDGGLHRMR